MSPNIMFSVRPTVRREHKRYHTHRFSFLAFPFLHIFLCSFVPNCVMVSNRCVGLVCMYENGTRKAGVCIGGRELFRLDGFSVGH